MRVRDGWTRLAAPAAIAALALLLLWPALANGPPLLFPDSIDYLTNGRDGLLGVTRPPGYAYAILPLWRAGGLWAVVAAQAALSAWLVWLTLDLALGRPGARVTARWLPLPGLVLAAASSLPFLASWILADALTAPTLLAGALLAAAGLRRAERAGLALTVLVGCMAHQTHPAMLVAALLTAALARLAGLAPRLSWRALAFTLMLPLLAVAAVVGLNRAIAGHADTAQASPTFLLARLVGDNLVQPRLETLCAEHPMRLCARRAWFDGIPLDGLLWRPDSPLWAEYGGFEALRADAQFINRRVLAEAWPTVLANGLRRAAAVSVALGLPDLDQRPMAEPLMSGLWNGLPELVQRVGASAQLRGTLTQVWPARTAPWAMLAGIVMLLGAVPVVLARRAGGTVALMILAGLAANALVVGLTAEPYDRYQARLAWLPLLLLLTALAAALHRRSAAA